MLEKVVKYRIRRIIQRCEYRQQKNAEHEQHTLIDTYGHDTPAPLDTNAQKHYGATNNKESTCIKNERADSNHAVDKETGGG
jgi:hypothetical protein